MRAALLTAAVPPYMNLLISPSNTGRICWPPTHPVRLRFLRPPPIANLFALTVFTFEIKQKSVDSDRSPLLTLSLRASASAKFQLLLCLSCKLGCGICLSERDNKTGLPRRRRRRLKPSGGARTFGDVSQVNLPDFVRTIEDRYLDSFIGTSQGTYVMICLDICLTWIPVLCLKNTQSNKS